MSNKPLYCQFYKTIHLLKNSYDELESTAVSSLYVKDFSDLRFQVGAVSDSHKPAFYLNDTHLQIIVIYRLNLPEEMKASILAMIQAVGSSCGSQLLEQFLLFITVEKENPYHVINYENASGLLARSPAQND